MTIPEYSKYSFDQNIVYKLNVLGDRVSEMNPTTKGGKPYFKLRDDNGKWRSVSLKKLKELCGICDIVLPPDAKQISFMGNGKYYIDENATVYSLNFSQHNGKVMTPRVNTEGYLAVNVDGTKIEVHILMARTFIQEDYIQKGLCCMHLNDVKTDCYLSNLKVGTYSENNKSAYTNGLNLGRKKLKNQ